VKARAAALELVEGASRLFVEGMKDQFFLDDQERSKFIEQLLADVRNPEFGLYTCLYEPLQLVLTKAPLLSGVGLRFKLAVTSENNWDERLDELE
jgi:hypothetical protein